jgi:hypothetical protein
MQDQASDQENYDDETSSSVEEPRYPDIGFDLSLPVKVFAWFKVRVSGILYISIK